MDKSLITVLTERGQTSVPASLRRADRLKPGAKLKWQRVSENEFRVQAIDTRKKPSARAMLGFAKQFHPNDKRSSDELLRELREGDAD